MKSVFAKTLYTGETVLEERYVNFKGNLISSVSHEPSGSVVGKFECITPAFVDAHCHIGMFRAGEPPNEADVNDHLDSILPLADALDGVMMDDSAFRESIEAGVLYSCVLPGSGNIIGGMSAVIRNYGYDTNEAFICRAGLKGAFGFNTMSPYSREKKGRRASTRMGCAALLRSEFYKIINRKKGEPLTAEQQVLREVLDGRTVLRVHVHKSDDIASLLRIVDEFKLRITVEHACDVYKRETFDELAKRKIPVIVGPVEGIGSKVELKHMSWRNLKLVLESGVEFGVMTDHDVNPQCNLFYTTRHLIRCGLAPLEAVNAVTSGNAKILGIDKFLGSLKKGKWASFTCWNGDPFSLLSYPVMVTAEGRTLFDEKGGE